MDTLLITRLNSLWQPVYHHLAQWVENWLPKQEAHILEMGPFSGGIIASLLQHHPTLQGTIVLGEENVAQAIQSSFGAPCPILISPLEHLPLLPTFSLAVCRGGLLLSDPPNHQRELPHSATRGPCPSGRRLRPHYAGPGHFPHCS